MRDDLLRAQGDACRALGRQREGFVHRVGVERLRSAEHGGEGLNRRPGDVDFGLLRGQRRTRRLRVKAQHQRTWVACAEAFAHDTRPQATRGAKLRDLFEEVVVRVEEEGEARCELIDFESGGERGFDVGDGVTERERHLLHGGRTGFADVIAADRNGVPVGDFAGAVGKGVGHEPQRRRGRINVRAARDVFLQDVVLNRALKLGGRDVLLLRHGNVETQQRRGGRVDGHRSRNGVERDAVKKSLHVFERINRDADLADLSGGERVVRVETDLRREIEGDGEARRPLREQIFVTRVRLFGGRVSGILAHRPEATAIQVATDAARIRIVAGRAEVAFVIGRIRVRRVEVVREFDARRGLKAFASFASRRSVGLRFHNRSSQLSRKVISSRIYQTMDNRR